MNIFPRNDILGRSKSERGIPDEQKCTAIGLLGKISALMGMGEEQIHLDYVLTPRKKLLGHGGVAKACIVLSLPPKGRRLHEQPLAITDDGNIGRVKRLKAPFVPMQSTDNGSIGRAMRLENPLFALRFKEQPVPLSTALGRVVGHTGITLGEMLEVQLDSRLETVGLVTGLHSDPSIPAIQTLQLREDYPQLPAA